jgi:HAD superfamily hydrolase (TIGR01509 family)
MSETTIDAVIFDMDGLLLDSERLYLRVFQRTAVDMDLEFPEALFARCIGRDAPDTDRILREHFGPGFDGAAFRARAMTGWHEHVETLGIPTKPGALELLDALDAAGVPRALATSTSRPRAEVAMRAGGLAERFAITVTGDEIGRGKPEPDIFLLAADRLAVEPRRCIVLEDSEPGVRGATAAGMRAIMVPDMLPPGEAARERAWAIVDSLHDARPLIADLLNGRQSRG